MKNVIDLQLFKIFLPDGDSKSFMIYHDLTKLFGDEDQYFTLKRIRKQIKAINLKRSPEIYSGGYSIGIRTSDPEVIFEMVKLIDFFSLPENKLGFLETDFDNLLYRLLSWKTPARQKWKKGDFFSIELQDNTFAFGQILSDTPTVALFDFKSPKTDILLDNLKKAKVLSIIHTTPNKLNNRDWEIIGSGEVIVSADSGPDGAYSLRIGLTSYSPNVLNSICRYYWFKESNWVNSDELQDLIMK